MKTTKINRRHFLKLTAASCAAMIGGACQAIPGLKTASQAEAAFPSPDVYLPLVTKPAENNIPTGLIIADHTVVDRYQSIPQTYIDKVKKMWANLPGESHSYAHRKGCQLLQEQDSRFKVNITEYNAPEGYTDQHLRISRITWGDVNNASGWKWDYGEEDWFTSETAVQHTKAHLDYCNGNGYEIAAMGFTWCWDMTSQQLDGNNYDPDYKVRWAGDSQGGPEGSQHWGLDLADSTQTGNSVCMDTYLNATVDYMNHCQEKGHPTRLFFTTGPVDNIWNTGESGYQREIKHQYIRDFVKKDDKRILFDYADILCWSNSDQHNTTGWPDSSGTPHIFPYIHEDNMLDLSGGYAEDGDHIGERGALRLAKALWWMLARIAGWDGK